MRYKLIHIYKLNGSYYVVFNIGITNRNLSSIRVRNHYINILQSQFMEVIASDINTL